MRQVLVPLAFVLSMACDKREETKSAPSSMLESAPPSLPTKRHPIATTPVSDEVDQIAPAPAAEESAVDISTPPTTLELMHAFLDAGWPNAKFSDKDEVFGLAFADLEGGDAASFLRVLIDRVANMLFIGMDSRLAHRAPVFADTWTHLGRLHALVAQASKRLIAKNDAYVCMSEGCDGIDHSAVACASSAASFTETEALVEEYADWLFGKRRRRKVGAVATPTKSLRNAMIDVASGMGAALRDCIGGKRLIERVFPHGRGPAFIRCQPFATESCTGIETAYEGTAHFGEEIVQPVPHAAFAVGEGELEFASSDGRRCHTFVSIRDAAAPRLTCPDETVVIALRDAHKLKSQIVVEDDCTKEIVIKQSPRTLRRGKRKVRFTAEDAGRNKTSCRVTVLVE